MGFLAGKKVLIIGVASKLSIATGIADAMHREGAEIALTYQTEKLKKRVVDFGKKWNSQLILPLDVSDDAQIEAVFEEISKQWGSIDIVVHSVGYAPAHELEGDYVDATTREGFAIAHDISAYSFVALAKYARPLMREKGGSLLTLTYLGSQQVVPNYNVMGLAKASLEANVRYMANSLGADGIRVNAISAGPIRTLAASGVKNFRKMLNETAKQAPLKRNVTIEEVGNAAAFMCSDLASGISGEILFVDGGFNTTAMHPLDDA
ncbi:enoyl-[acyl-carrier-protein] reductase [Oleiphilus sp. HI0009]|uniref:enoyl-ACP reductase FabI n=1 Tax=unclassified Oleiphilus TaxID=2631174 RepID=UPI0007C298AA|nr:MULTISPECIES: enoyl-ACP reductase [unclassified Oleiphilus]KZX82125.1 enoyl-[acyl-carrier-protein] reductase [Oleiphilus sp. HI0009]KZY66369.1 enoyl-[acyl-carrier-protein] reductase [Oleiphilus sp. HI0066]KZY71287.1 enoyl-[acyl-carrier-protein] reductase [Oleiphilus sp. HI0067]